MLKQSWYCPCREMSQPMKKRIKDIAADIGVSVATSLTNTGTEALGNYIL